MNNSNFKPGSIGKTIAFLLLASAAAPVLATPFKFRVAAPGIKPAAISAPAPTAPLLNFSSCNVTGRFGPTLAACQSAYAGQAALLATLAMPGYQGFQEWTVPTTGSYTITAAGAGGGTTTFAPAIGGHGAILSGTFVLTAGTVLQIVVGQAGIDAQYVGPTTVPDAGGGGGSFVVKKAGALPLVVAGGGGGANYNSGTYGSGGDGATGTSAPLAPIGNGGNTPNYGEPGAGFSTDGAFPAWNGGSGFAVAKSFANGAVGGFSTNSSGNGTANRFGGFGGGAGAHGNNCIGAGAGGGYAGGNAASSCWGGGGGSSYFDASATARATSTGTYNGTSVGAIALGYVPASTAGYVIIKQN